MAEQNTKGRLVDNIRVGVYDSHINVQVPDLHAEAMNATGGLSFDLSDQGIIVRPKPGGKLLQKTPHTRQGYHEVNLKYLADQDATIAGGTFGIVAVDSVLTCGGRVLGIAWPPRHHRTPVSAKGYQEPKPQILCTKEELIEFLVDTIQSSTSDRAAVEKIIDMAEFVIAGLKECEKG